MKFQVGRFTCELSLDNRREVQARWSPEPPKYLTRGERAEYQAGRTAFLESQGIMTSGRAATPRGRTAR